jgi:hypothetical protein
MSIIFNNPVVFHPQCDHTIINPHMSGEVIADQWIGKDFCVKSPHNVDSQLTADFKIQNQSQIT